MRYINIIPYFFLIRGITYERIPVDINKTFFNYTVLPHSEVLKSTA